MARSATGQRRCRSSRVCRPLRATGTHTAKGPPTNPEPLVTLQVANDIVEEISATLARQKQRLADAAACGGVGSNGSNPFGLHQNNTPGSSRNGSHSNSNGNSN